MEHIQIVQNLLYVTFELFIEDMDEDEDDSAKIQMTEIISFIEAILKIFISPTYQPYVSKEDETSLSKASLPFKEQLHNILTSNFIPVLNKNISNMMKDEQMFSICLSIYSD